MRRKKLTAAITLLLALVICTGAFMKLQKEVRSADLEKDSGFLTFSVLADVHADKDKLKASVIDLYFLNQETDAMVLNGDVVDEGVYEQYSDVRDVLDDSWSLLPDKVIHNIGNHEYFNYKRGRNTIADAINYRNLYFFFTGNISVYHDTWIKGYHFISLGSESANLKGANPPNAADLSESQLAWLKKKLKEKYEPGKPVFVFLHQHLKSGVKDWKGVIQEEELTEILSEHPEVILFTSHTHAPLAEEGVIQTDPFTIVNTGAVDYVMENGSQGLYVQVSGDTVVIGGRDFTDHYWIFSREIKK
ncbi:MAG: phosphohydrolase [Firmicutes bacterium]|nr:phosphohydrolase [Bacillota bacterium]